MNKNYKQGVRFEREVQKIFEKEGFETLRTAGSHSPFDVVLIKHEDRAGGIRRIAHVAFVQCKTEKK